MQIVSFNVCQNRYLSIKRSDNQLCEIIEQQIKSCFYDSRDDIRKWLYNTKIILPKNIKWEIEFISKILKNLNPLKDLKIIG